MKTFRMRLNVKTRGSCWWRSTVPKCQMLQSLQARHIMKCMMFLIILTPY